jgi:hypothetical protein
MSHCQHVAAVAAAKENQHAALQIFALNKRQNIKWKGH